MAVSRYIQVSSKLDTVADVRKLLSEFDALAKKAGLVGEPKLEWIDAREVSVVVDEASE